MHRQALLNSESGRLSMHSHALLQTTVGMKVWFILIISMRSAGPWEISAVKQGSGWAFLIQPPYKTAEGQQQCGSIREEQLSLLQLQVGQTRQTTLLRMTDVWFPWKNGDGRILQRGRNDVSPYDGLIGRSHGWWEEWELHFPSLNTWTKIHIPSSPGEPGLLANDSTAIDAKMWLKPWQQVVLLRF